MKIKKSIYSIQRIFAPLVFISSFPDETNTILKVFKDRKDSNKLFTRKSPSGKKSFDLLGKFSMSFL